MAELAIILPVLILFAIGVMDYGRVFFRSIMVANAARAGAEWGALDPVHYVNQAGAQAFAKLEAQEISGLAVASQLVCRCGDVVHDCSDTCGGTPPDVFVEVTATDSVAMLLKYPGLPSKIGISRTATFRAPP
jgi:Flp pilus assembly protein TadG